MISIDTFRSKFETFRPYRSPSSNKERSTRRLSSSTHKLVSPTCGTPWRGRDDAIFIAVGTSLFGLMAMDFPSTSGEDKEKKEDGPAQSIIGGTELPHQKEEEDPAQP